MSKSSRFPARLGNSSGQLGKNFIPHINAGFEVFMEDFIGKPDGKKGRAPVPTQQSSSRLAQSRRRVSAGRAAGRQKSRE
jgi:hypothetical protein